MSRESRGACDSRFVLDGAMVPESRLLRWWRGDSSTEGVKFSCSRSIASVDFDDGAAGQRQGGFDPAVLDARRQRRRSPVDDRGGFALASGGPGDAEDDRQGLDSSLLFGGAEAHLREGRGALVNSEGDFDFLVGSGRCGEEFAQVDNHVARPASGDGVDDGLVFSLPRSEASAGSPRTDCPRAQAERRARCRP